MQTALFAICCLLIVKRSKGYFASEIVIERTFLRDMNSGLVDGIRVRANGGINFGSNGFKCEDFNAVIPRGIYPSSTLHCECNSEASTFSFVDGKWQCVDNERFRQNEGKNSKFIGHYHKRFLFAFQPTVSAY